MDGRLWIVGEDGKRLPHNQQGRVFYQDPNVMMGLAESRADLARGDELGGILIPGT